MESVGDGVFVDLKTEAKSLSPLVLAYVGDAVYELYIRSKLVEKNLAKVHDLHQMAVKYVQAAGQAEIIHSWEGSLTEEEKEIVRRGRNAKGAVPRHSDMADYRYSTGFEALIGFLYLAGREARLLELLNSTDFFEF